MVEFGNIAVSQNMSAYAQFTETRFLLNWSLKGTGKGWMISWSISALKDDFPLPRKD